MALEALKAEKREKLGSIESRRVRAEGRVPAALYGFGKETEHLSLDGKEFNDVMLKHARVVKLGVGKESVQALVKDVQYDHLGDEVMHVDFYRVREGQKVRVKVRLEFIGHPKGVAAGGEFVHTLADLEVDCEVMQIPESIPVKVADLELNKSITVGELALPQGVSTTASKETVVCTVATKAVEPDPTTVEGAAAAAAAAGPEVIKKGPADEEAEGAEPAAKGGAKEEKAPKKEEKK